ncbi:hypothetical protein OK016_29275 [Vibrio chagasii]|nr:hypothetical protein [Vibrio chagasii]
MASRLAMQQQDLFNISSPETRRFTFMKIVYGRLHLLVTITNGLLTKVKADANPRCSFYFFYVATGEHPSNVAQTDRKRL